MKNFVRGGIALTVLSLFVAIIYAQTITTETLSSANDSQNTQNITETSKLTSNIKAELQAKDLDNKVTEEEQAREQYQGQQQDQDNKDPKIKKTVSSKAATANKGSFTATAYCLKGRTAMGHGVRRGIIAADPRVLKLGSQIQLGAGSYSGQYLVSDTGGGVRGRKIDIWMPSCAEARRFGRRTVTISVL